jgi:hypothetical protein
MALFGGGDSPAYGSPVRTTRRRGLSRILPSVIALALVAGGAWGALSFQHLVDQYTVWTFTPSQATESIVAASHLSAEGRFLFLASKPQVETAATFDANCSSEQEGNGILGCYLPTGRTIHLFDVTDPRLAGLEDVVAGQDEHRRAAEAHSRTRGGGEHAFDERRFHEQDGVLREGGAR